MKKKTMAFVMSLLMIVALVGVGFATWVITADTEKTANGNITVDAVVDTRIGLTATFTDNLGVVQDNSDKVVFGAPATPTDGWLTNDTESTEHLELFLKLEFTNLIQTVEGKTYGLSADGIALNIAAGGALYQAAETATYVGAIQDVLTIKKLYLATKAGGSDYFLSVTDASDQTLDGKDVEIDEVDGSASIIIPVTFKWGEAFGTKNPYTYFTGKDIDGVATSDGSHDGETWSQRAFRVLEDLHNLNGETFTITVTAKGTNLTK